MSEPAGSDAVTGQPADAAGAPSQRDRDRVLALVAYGVPVPQVAKVLGLPEDEVQQRFASELARGETEANMQVARSLFSKATGSGPQSVVAAIFWLKARAGWQDRPPVRRDDGEKNGTWHGEATARSSVNWDELLK